MDKFVIQGGAPLSGEITAAGNKNAALPILAACLLTDEEVVLSNVPRIRDTEAQVAPARELGRQGRLDRRERAAPLRRRGLGHRPSTRSSRRGSAPRSCSPGPLLARFGEAHMPPPGGDFIGRRRLDPHLDAFRDMGARVEGEREIEISAPAAGLKPCAIFMDEPSVMATENALMAAALTPGPTTIANAACEPHVQDLARLLVKMGAQIDGIGSNVMTVHGRDKLGGAEHRICPDHIEVASFMALAAATSGELRIRDAEPGGPGDDPAPVPAPRPAVDGRGQRRARPARAGRSRSATTSATRSRRSTTAPGPPSRPTSPRSRWRSPPRPRGRS